MESKCRICDAGERSSPSFALVIKVQLTISKRHMTSGKTHWASIGKLISLKYPEIRKLENGSGKSSSIC